MAGEINPGAIAFVRSHWPNADISGTGGPWAILRLPHSLHLNRPSVIFFPSQAEARAEGAKTGDRVIECATPVPTKVREIGYRDRDDDERWERKLGVDGL